jgi:hypothetical protein
MRPVLAALAVVTVPALASHPGAAAPPRPLPRFELVDSSGARVSSASLPRPGNWLLLYVQPADRLTKLLLEAATIKDDEGGGARPAMVVVVGGRIEEARALAARHSEIRQAEWYADPSRAAYEGLGLAGTPAVRGIEGPDIQWSLEGVLADPARLRSMLAAWRER